MKKKIYIILANIILIMSMFVGCAREEVIEETDRFANPNGGNVIVEEIITEDILDEDIIVENIG